MRVSGTTQSEGWLSLASLRIMASASTIPPRPSAFSTSSWERPCSSTSLALPWSRALKSRRRRSASDNRHTGQSGSSTGATKSTGPSCNNRASGCGTRRLLDRAMSLHLLPVDQRRLDTRVIERLQVSPNRHTVVLPTHGGSAIHANKHRERDETERAPLSVGRLQLLQRSFQLHLRLPRRAIVISSRSASDAS